MGEYVKVFPEAEAKQNREIELMEESAPKERNAKAVYEREVIEPTREKYERKLKEIQDEMLSCASGEVLLEVRSAHLLVLINCAGFRNALLSDDFDTCLQGPGLREYQKLGENRRILDSIIAGAVQVQAKYITQIILNDTGNTIVNENFDWIYERPFSGPPPIELLSSYLSHKFAR